MTAFNRLKTGFDFKPKEIHLEDQKSESEIMIVSSLGLESRQNYEDFLGEIAVQINPLKSQQDCSKNIRI